MPLKLYNMSKLCNCSRAQDLEDKKEKCGVFVGCNSVGVRNVHFNCVVAGVQVLGYAVEDYLLVCS